jgi:hypothetical protein
MSWGAPTYVGNASEACRRCVHNADCRAACHARQPVLCESGVHVVPDRPDVGGQPRVPCRIRFVSILRAGEQFTSRQLAERAGASVSSVREWISDQVKAGRVAIIGSEPIYIANKCGGRQSIYRFAPPPDHARSVTLDSQVSLGPGVLSGSQVPLGSLLEAIP